MLSNDAQLKIVQDQIKRLKSALSSLERDVKPQSKQQFEVMSEGYVDQLADLQALVKAYNTGPTGKRTPAPQRPLPRKPAPNRSRPAFIVDDAAPRKVDIMICCQIFIFLLGLGFVHLAIGSVNCRWWTYGISGIVLFALMIGPADVLMAALAPRPIPARNDLRLGLMAVLTLVVLGIIGQLRQPTITCANCGKRCRGSANCSICPQCDVSISVGAIKIPGKSVLLDAVVEGNVANVGAVLTDHPGLVSTKDINGLTPLHSAVVCGRKEIVELLLASNAEVNAKADGVGTPLQLATLGGQQDLAELLRQHGGL